MRNVLLLPIPAIQCAMLEVVRRKKVKKKIEEKKCSQSTSSATTSHCKSKFNGIGNAAAASFFSLSFVSKRAAILAKELNCVVLSTHNSLSHGLRRRRFVIGNDF